jgi:hypothetical protein
MNDTTSSSALEAPQPDTLTFLDTTPRKPTFAEWLKVAQAGESFVYHTGFLADRIKPPSPADKAEADAALLAFSRGEVELAQRRIKPCVGNKPGSFEYIA